MQRIIILMLAVAMVGCSSVEIVKVSDSTYSDGLRFYRPDLYLLVTRDKEQTLVMSIIPLPNKKEEYVIKPNILLGTVEVSATLEGGWNLTQIGTKVDTKIPETITAFTGILQAAGGIAKTSLPLDPGLYRIEFDGQTGKVSGIKKIEIDLKP